MRFYQTLLTGAALISAALAVEINKFPSTAEAGKSYEITYSPGGNAATTIILRKGDSNNLANVSTLTTTATGGSYQWTVDRALTSSKDYALMIVQGGEANYVGPIAISGGAASASASASSSASASASKSASASSASGSTLATITSASASASASAGGNSTVSLPSLSSGAATATSARATGSSTATSSGGGAPANTGAASSLSSSPLALIFGAVAAMAYLN